MDDLLINPKLKGKRNYIHGTDICMKALAHLGKVNDFTITLRRQTNRAVIMVCEEAEGHDKENYIGKITAKRVLMSESSLNQEFLLIESNVSTNERVDYSEKTILNESCISEIDSSILFYKPMNYHIIEAIISINKHLLNSKIENQGWLFTKMTLTHWPISEKCHFKLTLERILGKSLAVTGIYQNNDRVGEITFTKGGSK